ncbi:MAG: MBL fold metallo-hydrolase [Candidatus Sericytochromatia bacterium]|nr:MBL fold metallo-hydrolase [Candidatus Sericytochromatia bacterium]
MVRILTVGPFQENCYLIRRGDDLAVVDPGEEADRLIAAIEAEGAKPRYILLTHAHLDHVGAAAELQARFGIPLYVPRDEVRLLEQLPLQCSLFGMPPMVAPRIDHLLDGGQALPLGDTVIEAVLTPGHSPGGVSYRIDDEMFVGDTIFAGSVGRTDLWGGSWETLKASIETHIFSLPDHTVLYPGHGPSTTVGQERSHNPFFN